jgi:hypothetical protein
VFRYRIILFVIMFISLQVSLLSGDWSRNLGKMDLNSADRKCKSRGMRLPTINELQTAYESGEISTKLGGGFFWSSTQNEGDRYYYLNMGTGSVDWVQSHYWDVSVICIKK